MGPDPNSKVDNLHASVALTPPKQKVPAQDYDWAASYFYTDEVAYAEEPNAIEFHNVGIWKNRRTMRSGWFRNISPIGAWGLKLGNVYNSNGEIVGKPEEVINNFEVDMSFSSIPSEA